LLPLNRLVASPPALLSPLTPPVAACVKLREPVVAPPSAFESVTEPPLPPSSSAFPPVADPWTTTGPPEDWPKTAGPAPPFDSWAEPPFPPLKPLLPPTALADTLTGPLSPIAFAAAVVAPPLPPIFPGPPSPPVAVAVAETVPEAPGVVVAADALAVPPAPPRFPRPPAPPIALDRLELFPEPSVVVVVAVALAAPPLPQLSGPLPPAPPVAKAEFVESEGLFAVAAASSPLPPSPVAESAPSSEPGMRGTVTVSAIAGEIAASPMTATHNNSLAFVVSSPQASGDHADHAPVGHALSPFFDKRLGRNRNRREAHLSPRAASVARFFIAVYSGYFGGGIGLLMMAALTMMGLAVRNAGAAKNILGGVINASGSRSSFFPRTCVGCRRLYRDRRLVRRLGRRLDAETRQREALEVGGRRPWRCAHDGAVLDRALALKMRERSNET
jgi:hypothetical protein